MGQSPPGSTYNEDGEGTVFGSINKQNFDALRIVEPRSEVIEGFEKLVGDIDSNIENLDDETA